MTRGTWGGAFLGVAGLLTAMGCYAGLVQRDHVAGATAVGAGMLALWAAVALLKR